MHAFDRRTDGQTEISSLDRVCIACSAVKIKASVMISEWTVCYRACSHLLKLYVIIFTFYLEWFKHSKHSARYIFDHDRQWYGLMVLVSVSDRRNPVLVSVFVSSLWSWSRSQTMWSWSRSHLLPSLSRSRLWTGSGTLFMPTTVCQSRACTDYRRTDGQTEISSRPRTHNRQLPDHSGHLTDSNFFTRLLYNDIY